MTPTTLPSLRHKALADAMGTARILLRMLDLLKAAGVATLGAALAACARHRATPSTTRPARQSASRNDRPTSPPRRSACH
jgi:hypothetical protein